MADTPEETSPPIAYVGAAVALLCLVALAVAAALGVLPIGDGQDDELFLLLLGTSG